MRCLPLTLLLLFICAAAQAQTKTPIVEKNIKECFKKTAKTPRSFDWCVAEEFRRVREAKNYREARIMAGKDPDAGCGKDRGSKECFDEIMAGWRDTSDRLYDGLGSGTRYPYIPRLSYRPYYRYRYYYPRYYYPRFPFTYPRRLGTTYRRGWRY